MTLHDRLKPVPVDESASSTWNGAVVGLALAVFAAGVAVAMPYSMRPVSDTAARPTKRGPLASPSVDPDAVTLPSPGVSALPERPSAAAPDPTPSATVAAEPEREVSPARPPVVRKEVGRREDDETDDHGSDEIDDDDDSKASKDERSAHGPSDTERRPAAGKKRGAGPPNASGQGSAGTEEARHNKEHHSGRGNDKRGKR